MILRDMAFSWVEGCDGHRSPRPTRRFTARPQHRGLTIRGRGLTFARKDLSRTPGLA
jgi:hypothetical protein